jgi:hypothetical protein
MRNIFRDESNERQFRKDGYIIVDLLDAETIADLCSFSTTAFSSRREVVPYARELPHYISIFDREPAHKREVDKRISGFIARPIDELLEDYEVVFP